MLILYRLFATLGAFLLGAPILLLFGQGLAGRPLIFLPWLFVSLLCALLVRYCKKGRMALCVLFTALLFAGTLHHARSLSMTYTAIFPALLCAGFVPLHLLLLCQAPGEEYPPTLWYLGVFLYAVSLFLLRAESLAAASPQLKAFACAYFVYVIFVLNELSLNNGMAGDKRPSPLMRWRNRLRAGMLAFCLVIAANLDAIGRAVSAALIFIRDVLWAIIQWLMRVETENVRDAGERGSLDLSGLAEGAETPRFWIILEQIIRVLAIVGALILCLLILKKFLNVLKKALLFLIEQLRRYAGQINNAYEDTVESLLDWGEVRRGMLRRKAAPRKKAPAIAWGQLSPRESVRMRYKVLRNRGQEHPGNLTARQVILQKNVSPQAADLYDRARYSSEEISAQDAENMKELVK